MNFLVHSEVPKNALSKRAFFVCGNMLENHREIQSNRGFYASSGMSHQLMNVRMQLLNAQWLRLEM